MYLCKINANLLKWITYVIRTSLARGIEIREHRKIVMIKSGEKIWFCPYYAESTLLALATNPKLVWKCLAWFWRRVSVDLSYFYDKNQKMRERKRKQIIEKIMDIKNSWKTVTTIRRTRLSWVQTCGYVANQHSASALANIFGLWQKTETRRIARKRLQTYKNLALWVKEIQMGPNGHVSQHIISLLT